MPAARHHMPWGGQALMLKKKKKKKGKKKKERKNQTCTDKPTDTRLVRDAPNLTAALAMEASHWVTGVNYSLGGQGKSHQNISSQMDHFSAVLTFSVWEWRKNPKQKQTPPQPPKKEGKKKVCVRERERMATHSSCLKAELIGYIKPLAAWLGTQSL